jgi:hypothetical protein
MDMPRTKEREVLDVNCGICGGAARYAFSDLVLSKHECSYYYCDRCTCLFAGFPTWLDEAYTDAVSATDTGIIARNESLCASLMALLGKLYKTAPCVLDFGAGYGLMVRMLRDRGVKAFWYDKYCVNLFARGFEYDPSTKPDAIIAFEVIEHLQDPADFFAYSFSIADSIIVSTELLPEGLLSGERRDWWYLSKETGQHIFFYSESTFLEIAKKHSAHYFNLAPLHVLTRNEESIKALERLLDGRRRFTAIFLRALASMGSKMSCFPKDGRFTSYETLTWQDHLLCVEVVKNGAADMKGRCPQG